MYTEFPKDVDPANPTVAFVLFFKEFEIEMKNKFIYPKDHINFMGGRNEIDESDLRKFLEDFVVVRKTPIQMIILHEMGYPFTIYNPKDLVYIYDLVQLHINDWTNIIKNPLSGRVPPPPKDFIMMENFVHHFASEALKYKQKFEPVNNTDSISIFNELFGIVSPELNAVGVDKAPNRNNAFEEPTNIRDAWEVNPWGDKHGSS